MSHQYWIVTSDDKNGDTCPTDTYLAPTHLDLAKPDIRRPRCVSKHNCKTGVRILGCKTKGVKLVANITTMLNTTSKPELVKFYDKLSIAIIIKSNHFRQISAVSRQIPNLPGMNRELINRHLSPLTVTAKGHMTRSRKMLMLMRGINYKKRRLYKNGRYGTRQINMHGTRE